MDDSTGEWPVRGGIVPAGRRNGSEAAGPDNDTNRSVATCSDKTATPDDTPRPRGQSEGTAIGERIAEFKLASRTEIAARHNLQRRLHTNEKVAHQTTQGAHTGIVGTSTGVVRLRPESLHEEGAGCNEITF